MKLLMSISIGLHQGLHCFSILDLPLPCKGIEVSLGRSKKHKLGSVMLSVFCPPRIINPNQKVSFLLIPFPPPRVARMSDCMGAVSNLVCFALPITFRSHSPVSNQTGNWVQSRSPFERRFWHLGAKKWPNWAEKIGRKKRSTRRTKPQG